MGLSIHLAVVGSQH